MENKTIHESLQEYLKNTPKEKVLEDWDEFQHLDKEGITVKEFLENQKQTDEKGRPLTYWGGLEERGEEKLEEVAERLRGKDVSGIGRKQFLYGQPSGVAGQMRVWHGELLRRHQQ